MNYVEEDIAHEKLYADYKRLYETNKDLLDGMSYAAVVQQGILPQARHLKTLFSEYFLIYKPQNIIGGDLYWVGQKGKWKFFSVGDCTGHGVSGAMLSVLGLSFLNYIVLGKDFVSPGKILKELDKKWIETFHQGAELGYSNDWMEIGICAFNEETKELKFAGAFNKLICISETGTTILEGNRYPIGGWQLESNRTFNDLSIYLKQPTMIYLYSDGYKDQFGDLSKKRFSSKRLDALLKNIFAIPATEQLNKIEEEFIFWKGAEEQTDDVCVFGIRLPC